MQKGLVVVQFGIVVLFLIVTGIIYHQMKFVQNKELGFNKEQVVYFNVGVLKGQFSAFKEQLLNYPSIVNVSSGQPPGLGRMNMAMMSKDSSGNSNHLSILRVGYDYIETMELELKSGRTFSKKYATDVKSSVILNELALNWFDIQKDAVGKTIEIDGQRKVIGVVANFHNESLKEKRQPVALLLNPRTKWTALVRLSSSNIQQGITDIKTVWSTFLPGRPLDFSFLDESIEAQYRQEQKQATLMTVFTGIAILIACFGLFGLTALITTNRTKEIGIRKVMGATVSNIVGLLSKDFLKLVLIGFVIAVPVAWYFMNQWLQDFAYRIDIGIGIFLLAGGLALLIALTTVSWQSVRAALANPVDSLRSE